MSMAIRPMTVGQAEDRTREQWTAEVLFHPPGKPGHVYVAQVVAHVRANDVDELARLVKDVTYQQQVRNRS